MLKFLALVLGHLWREVVQRAGPLFNPVMASRWHGPVHNTAIMLRVSELYAQYGPDIIVKSDYRGAGGASIICWGCVPGKVLVGEVTAEDQPDLNARASLVAGMAEASEDILTINQQATVAPGTDFGNEVNRRRHGRAESDRDRVRQRDSGNPTIRN